MVWHNKVIKRMSQELDFWGALSDVSFLAIVNGGLRKILHWYQWVKNWEWASKNY